MTKLGTSLFAAGLLLAGMQAFADDTQEGTMNKEQMMKDCMARMTAKDDGATKEQIHSACEAEIKKGMDMRKHGMGMGKDHMDKEHMSPPN